jgi:hypothetical protein
VTESILANQDQERDGLDGEFEKTVYTREASKKSIKRIGSCSIAVCLIIGY